MYDYDDFNESAFCWLDYNAHAYPALAYRMEARFPRRDFLRNPNALPF